ncbi:MAG: M28 family peptidase [Fulvivirga sp.]
MTKQLIIGLTVLSILAISCDSSKKTTTEDKVSKNVKIVKAPSFNADSAYSFVKKQVDFGPRVPSTRPHIDAGDYLVEKLKSYNWEVTEQTFDATSFDYKPMALRNIIASYNPQIKTKRILLAAHWDSRPFADKDTERKDEAILGANDGASGVGVLLEIARLLSQSDSLAIGVDIIFFDGEDWGNDSSHQKYTPVRDGWEDWWCLGSQYWSKNKHQRGYSAYYGILLDMVGGKNAKFYVEGHSNFYAPSIVDKVWGQASKLGYDRYFIRKEGGAITDDHYFVNEYAKIPMIDVIPTDPVSNSFGDFHHTHKDNMDIISRETLQAVGQTVIKVLYTEKP